MDPYAVLGLTPDADEREIARAYRDLARLHHPDHAGDTLRMAQINAAYDELRKRGRAAQLAPRRPRPEPARHGAWLRADVRRALGPELLRALERDEAVHVVCRAATWDSHDVLLVVTDRRLLWLRADAFSQRVRWLRFSELTAVETRLKRPFRRVGEVRATPRHGGRRHSFTDVRPDLLDAIARVVGPALAPG